MDRTHTGWALVISLALHMVPLAHAVAWPSAPRVDSVMDVALDLPAVVVGETFDIEAAAAVPTPAAAAETSPAKTPPRALPDPPVVRAPAATPARSVESDGGVDQAASPPAAGAPPSGTYGEDRQVAPAAALGKGLLRVLPRASFPEKTFHELPFGTKLRLRFSVDLDSAGRTTQPPTFDRERRSPAWFDALVVRALLLLRAGTFAAPASTPGPLGHDFELEAEIVSGKSREGDWLEAQDLAEIGRLVEPTLREPGRAHFVYNSGREVRLTLRLVPRK